jgi:hypothetical protein
LFSFGRSGTTVFCDFLNTHPDVVTFGEVLNQDAFHSYFNTLNTSAARRAGVYPSTIETGFYDFAGQMVAKHKSSLCLFDMKFESLHTIEGNWRKPGHDFKIFEYLLNSDCVVILLERRDLVARYLSHELAAKRSQYHSFQKASPGTIEPFAIDLAELDTEIEIARRQVAWVADRFSNHKRFIHTAYEELFEPVNGGPETQFSPALAEELAVLLGIDNKFDVTPQLQKVSNRPMDTYITNHREVAGYQASMQ